MIFIFFQESLLRSFIIRNKRPKRIFLNIFSIKEFFYQFFICEFFHEKYKSNYSEEIFRQFFYSPLKIFLWYKIPSRILDPEFLAEYFILNHENFISKARWRGSHDSRWNTRSHLESWEPLRHAFDAKSFQGPAYKGDESMPEYFKVIYEKRVPERFQKRGGENLYKRIHGDRRTLHQRISRRDLYIKGKMENCSLSFIWIFFAGTLEGRGPFDLLAWSRILGSHYQKSKWLPRSSLSL